MTHNNGIIIKKIAQLEIDLVYIFNIYFFLNNQIVSHFVFGKLGLITFKTKKKMDYTLK